MWNRKKKQKIQPMEVFVINHNVQSLFFDVEIISPTRVNIIVMPRTEAEKGKGVLIVPNGVVQLLKVSS